MFEGGPIPYPQREFLSEDDNEDKSSSKSTASGANSTHGQPPAKRVRVLPPSTSSGTMNMNTYVSACKRTCHLYCCCTYSDTCQVVVESFQRIQSLFYTILELLGHVVSIAWTERSL